MVANAASRPCRSASARTRWHHEVGVGGVDVDRAQDVVGRQPRRVGGLAVGAPLHGSRAVAAADVALSVLGHQPSFSPGSGRAPRAQSAAAIAFLPCARTSPSTTACEAGADADAVLVDAELAGRERGVVGQHRHRRELEPLAAERRPRARRRRAGADLAVDAHRRCGAVDLGVVDGDLGGERHAVGRLRRPDEQAGLEPVHRRHQQPRAGHGEPAEQVAARVRGRDGLGDDAEDRAGVEPLLEQEGGGAGDVVAVPHRVLHGCRAAPGGQQREVQVDPAEARDVEGGTRDQRAVRDDRAAVGCDAR